MAFVGKEGRIMISLYDTAFWDLSGCEAKSLLGIKHLPLAGLFNGEWFDFAKQGGL